MEQGIRIRTTILVWVFFLALSGLNAQSCLPEGIIFTTQSQIDSFQINYPNCTEIEGDMTIQGNNITNLNGLSVLTSIGGSVIIEFNDSLISLSGMGGLATIGEHLNIWWNSSLTSLSGLEGLISVGSGLVIHANSSLTSLSGLDGLTSIGGSLTLSFSSALTSLSGLESLTTIGGDLKIESNAALTNISGLESLTSLGGGLWIYVNEALESLAGLEGVTQIMGDLTITTGDALQSLSGLEGVIYIEGSLHMAGNHSLTSLSGLENVATIGGEVAIYVHDSITSLSGLESLTSIGGDLRIKHCDALTSLTGIDSIDATSITNLVIEGNSSLSTCDVQSICDYLASPNGTVEILDNNQGCDSPQEVEEACTVGVPEQESALQLSAYPNPFTTSTTIEYELTEPSHVQLTIYNAIGEVVYRTEDRMMLKGSHTVTWSPGHLPEGMYYGVLRSEEGVAVVKIIKQ